MAVGVAGKIKLFFWLAFGISLLAVTLAAIGPGRPLGQPWTERDEIRVVAWMFFTPSSTTVSVVSICRQERVHTVTGATPAKQKRIDCRMRRGDRFQVDVKANGIFTGCEWTRPV